MNLHNILLPSKFATSKLDVDFFSTHQHRLIAIIRDEFFADNYDSILKYQLIRIISEHCVIFQVDCLLQLDTDQINFCEGDPIEEEEQTYPSKVSFFVLNLDVNSQTLNLIKFYEVESICNEMWIMIVEQLKQECQTFNFVENNDEVSISFYDYYISYRMVINHNTKKALFWVEHILQFQDQEQEIKEFRAPVLTNAIVFNIVYSDNDIQYCPTTTELNLHHKKELA